MTQMNTRFFSNREQAGLELAKRLKKYSTENPVVLALPRGGVPVGHAIAKILNAPLDVVIARKIGLPSNKEFGIGAISEEDSVILDQGTISLLELPVWYLKNIIDEEKTELKRRLKLYRQNKALPDLKNKTVILVDDGLATGVTARAAIETIKKQNPKKIVFASPVCAYDSVQNLKSLVDEVICVATPLEFLAVGNWYQYFPQLSDQQVLEILSHSKQSKRPNRLSEPLYLQQGG